jgi:hypothetical protein
MSSCVVMIVLYERKAPLVSALWARRDTAPRLARAVEAGTAGH